MSLLSVRQNFIKTSGRLDLATTDTEEHDTDNGADFYINGGIKDLDVEVNVPGSVAYYEKVMLAGASSAVLQYCRSVKQLWIVGTDGEKELLIYKTYDVLSALYPAMGGTNPGIPEFWALDSIYRDPANYSKGTGHDYKGVIWMPPIEAGSSVVLGSDAATYYICLVSHTSTADTTPSTGTDWEDYWVVTTDATGDAHEVETAYFNVRLLVYGLFHSLVLALNADDNWWTLNYENIVVFAALRHLEGFYRNTQGWNDYNNRIQPLLTGIDKDNAEQATAGAMEMSG